MHPSRSVMSELVNNAHTESGHGSTSKTLALLRETYFIIRGRRLTSKIIRRCRICQEMKNKPMQVPWGNLPAARVAPARAFENIGIDAFGPINHKGGKVYALIFACMSTRAVHLEVVENLESQSIMNALRKFIARRGVPSLVYSDNATNFKKIGKQLNATIDDLKLKWHFITPYAPNRGGCAARQPIPERPSPPGSRTLRAQTTAGRAPSPPER